MKTRQAILFLGVVLGLLRAQASDPAIGEVTVRQRWP
jgi:hypothetical protein